MCVPEDDEPEFGPIILAADEVPLNAPRRFALLSYEGNDDEDDSADDDEDDQPAVFMWGLQIGERAIAVDPGGRQIVKAGSAERALRLFSLVHDLDLVWLDPPPDTPGT